MFLPEAPAATCFLNHRLALVGDKNAQYGQFNSSVRRAVRKAEKSELSIEFSRDLDAVHTFYALLCLTRKRHGVPPQPFSFFSHIYQQILVPGKGWVVIARHRGRPVAGAVFFHFGQSVLYKFGASDHSYQHLRANNLVMAQAIEWHRQNGFTSFDFGRTSIHQRGLQEFKLGWGSAERQIEYVRLDPRKGEFLITPDDESGLSQPIFRLLPVSISRVIGAALYRHVA